MTDRLKHKYNLTKADGRPCHGRYFVLKIDSKDPKHAEACRSAVLRYAIAIQDHLPELAEDIKAAIIDHGRTGTWDAWDECLGRLE
jgi:hypothetical protein